MSAFSASVAITLGVDLSDVKARLGKGSVAVLDKRAVLMRASILDLWRDWNYKGVPKKARGRSGPAWRTKVQATEGVRSVIVENKARSFYGREPYAAYVHRAGSSTLEWKNVRAMLLSEHGPALQRELTEAVRTEIAKGALGPKKRVRENRQTQFKRATFTG